MKENGISDGFIGNDRLKNVLLPELSSGNCAHAYIIEGPSGSGKHTAARLMCQSVMCMNRGNKDIKVPCGECLACRKIEEGISPDVLTISNGDKATIGVETARQIKQTLYISPNDGDKKIYIIENAHLMTAQAQNSLLLSIEEPPPYAMFILLAEDSSMLLETVRSRAPAVRTELFTAERIASYLTELSDLTPAMRERIPVAAHLCGGAVGTAVRILRGGEDELLLYRTAEELISIILNGRKTEGLYYIQKNLPKERDKARELLLLMRAAVRDAIALKCGGELLFYTTPPEYLKKIPRKRALELSEALVRAEGDIAANCSQNTVMTALICSK